MTEASLPPPEATWRVTYEGPCTAEAVALLQGLGPVSSSGPGVVALIPAHAVDAVTDALWDLAPRAWAVVPAADPAARTLPGAEPPEHHDWGLP